MSQFIHMSVLFLQIFEMGTLLNIKRTIINMLMWTTVWYLLRLLLKNTFHVSNLWIKACYIFDFNFTRLAICSFSILTICNISYFRLWFWGLGLSSVCFSS